MLLLQVSLDRPTPQANRGRGRILLFDSYYSELFSGDGRVAASDCGAYVPKKVPTDLSD